MNTHKEMEAYFSYIETIVPNFLSMFNMWVARHRIQFWPSTLNHCFRKFRAVLVSAVPQCLADGQCESC